VHGIRIADAGAIVTTGRVGALQTHYDFRDLIILQVEGSKRWRIYGPRVVRPARTSYVNEPPQTPPLLDTLLQAGDMLFMPAGFWHVCDNGPDRSLHLGLFLKPPVTDLPSPVDAMHQKQR
jgi:ribosomal protein L16 Arg81 hydroxylase